MAKTIQKRSEMDPAYQWDTAAIFPSDEAWEKALEAARNYVPQAKSYEGRLCESPETLLAFLDMEEKVGEELSTLYGYTSLKADEDTAVAKYQEMKGRAMSLIVALDTAASFKTPELIALDEETLESFYAACPALEKYRVAIHNVRRRKAHVLSPKEEALLAAAGEMAESPHQAYNLFVNADLKFPDAVDAQGNRHPLTAGQLVTLLQSPDRTLRENAFCTFYDVHRGMCNTTAALLDGQAKQLQFFANARGYGSALEASLDNTNVPVSVYENLLEAVNRNLPAMHKYMALRKKLMGLDELHMYDLYTPMVAEADVEISFEQAKETVLEACAVLGEDYVRVLKEAFANRWIDVYENVGKRSGAYSSGMAKPHPFVLLNHKDDLDAQFTLAHEMGHAMHSYLSHKNQPGVYAGYVIFVAEVASTVNEALLMQHLLKKTTDKKQRAYLINYFLEQFRTTVYRQTMFAEFEKLTGEMAGRGETLTAEALNRLYLELNQRYYGPAVHVDERIAVEWARIPHFYYNYYVFQYATGFSAAMAISKRILEQGESAVQDYLRFLSSGCSKTPIELLKIAGADMTTAAPINAALELFDSLIGQLEELMA